MDHRSTRRSAQRIVFAPLVAALAVAASAQTKPEAEPAEEPATAFGSEVDVVDVLLDVLVTDDDGNVVLGLGPEDFIVEDGGVEIPVDSASFYSNRRYLGPLDALGDRRGEPSGGDAPAEPPVERTFVLLFCRPSLALAGGDRSRLLRFPEAGRESTGWAIEELLPSDHVAVLSHDTRLRLHHDFTRDRDRLSEAIHRASTGKPPRKRWPSRTETPVAGLSIASVVEPGEEARPAEPLLEALAALADGLAGVRGRKNLVLIGAELPVPGSPEDRRLYPAAAAALNDANVAVYTVGVTLRGRQESLARLAADTGGRYSPRVLDFRRPLVTVARESSGYYLVSYRARHQRGETGFRRVTVRTRNPEFEVRARSGYRIGE